MNNVETAVSKLVVGLTGGIGSGKSTVTGFFGELGIEVIDADEVSRELTAKRSPLLRNLADHFGEAIMTPEAELDRSALRKIIFHDTTEKIWLENLLHPLIRKEIIQRLQASSSCYVIVSVPLLLESEAYNFVDRVLVIDSPHTSQRDRVVRRDGVSGEEAERVIAAQLSREQRLKLADDIIINDASIEQLRQKVNKLHEFYRTQKAEGNQAG